MKFLKSKAMLLLVCISSTSVCAATASERWEQVAETRSGTKFYMSAFAGRINAYSSIVREWSLWDYSSAIEPAPYGSDKFLHDYDCEKRLLKVIRHLSYKRGMGAGEVIDDHTYATPEWKDIPRGGAADHLLTRICAQYQRAMTDGR